MTPTTDHIVRVIDLLGTAAFAFSGALRAVDRKPDLVGMLILATVTAVGGSTLRDVLLRRDPVFLRDSAYAVAIVLPALVVFFFPRAVLRREGIFKYFDAVGLGVFSAMTAAVTYAGNERGRR